MAEYWYDEADRRIRKEVSGVVTNYVYDGDGLNALIIYTMQMVTERKRHSDKSLLRQMLVQLNKVSFRLQ